jgi:hypothetical protein
MSNETRRAIDYLVGALRVSVRDGQRACDTPDALYHVGVILRRMGSDVAALAAILRETQKDAAPTRRRRKRRDVPAARPEPPPSRDVEPPTGGWPEGQFQPGAPAPKERKPGRRRKARNAEPTTPTAKENDHG